MFKRGLGCARPESLGSSVEFVVSVIASIPNLLRVCYTLSKQGVQGSAFLFIALSFAAFWCDLSSLIALC